MSRTFYDRVWARYGRAHSEKFLKHLKAQMRTHGVSQAALARRSGFHEGHVSRWMNEHVTPSLETKLILDEALDLIIKELGS